MDPEDESGPGGQGQNLHDLQNYLSNFKKEDPNDDILSHIDVSDVSDLYTATSGNSLQELGVVSQFSAGFYTEQGMLDSTLSEDASQQIHGLETSDSGIKQEVKQEVSSLDLDAVQAQISSFGSTSLAQGINYIQTNSISGDLIMTSLEDTLDPSGGKVIRIVSLDEDGQYLSLGDASQMQILNQDIELTADTSGVLNLPQAGSSMVSNSTTHASSLLTSGPAVVASGSGDATMSDVSDLNKSTGEEGQIDTSADQSQIVTLPQGTTLTTDALQMSGLLSSDGTISSDLGFQTITIMPPDMSQGGDMNYVLIMGPPDGSKDGVQQLAQFFDFKQSNQELSEDLVEINGEVRRVLRVVPKKMVGANFGMQLVCNYCDYTSPKRYLLTRHMKSHSDERPHKCKECDRGFKTPASLMNHINTHTGTRPHKCKNCDAAFTTSGELVRHIRYRHTFEKPHRCPNCEYASVELSKLKRHMRSHTGERPYKCPHCPYASPDTYKLKRHLRIHTGEKPYECDICHTRFTQSNSLKAHKLIHSGNKPVFQCKLCPTTCGRKTDLKIHFNKLHSEGSPTECKKCGQVFSDRYSYKQHVKSHDGDKCFKCEECDYVASTERSFDIHAAVHSNEKKFECENCQQAFNLKQTLERHKLTCQTVEELDSSVDKESDEQSCDKTTLTPRLSQQSKSESPLSETNSVSLTSAGPLASDTLHRNLLQDIKDGKLGDVPQVVIVHPDGSFEEISSRHPNGDKMNIYDLFSALSSGDKEPELDSKNLDVNRDSEEEDGEKEQETLPTLKRKQNQASCHLRDQEVIGESSQCEASTQAELESDTDTDSVPDKPDGESIEIKDSTASLGGQYLNGSQDQSSLDHPEMSENITNDSIASHLSDANTGDSISSHLSDAMAADISTDMANAATSSATASSSDHLQSFIQIMTPTSGSVSSLLTPGTEQVATSTPQYVVVKGYTCNSESGQPTMFNVAVDRDSLFKMFASFNNIGDGGEVQLLAGDLDSLNVTLDSKTNVISRTPDQLGEYSGLPQMTDGSIVEQVDGDEPSFDEALKPSSSLDLYKDRPSSGQFKYSTLSIDTLSMGRSPQNVDSSPPKELLSPGLSNKASPPLPSDSTHHIDAFREVTHPVVPHIKSTHKSADHCLESLGSSSIDIGMDVFSEVMPSSQTPTPEHTLDSSCFINTDKEHINIKLLQPVSDIQPDCAQNMPEINGSTGDEGNSIQQKKNSSRKRSQGADPSLVMTGKRVRKALVKVSM